MNFTLPFKLLSLFTVYLCHFVYVWAIDCPQTVYVELGQDGVINCHLGNDGDIYWYKGNSTKTSPIIRLENGQRKISQENGPYDVDEDGALIIKSLERQYYGFYSVLNFFTKDQHDTAQVKLEMAVKPQTMCPVITGCNYCDECKLTESETSNISCSITGTRPQVDLVIVTDSENWIDVTRNASEAAYDPETGTWSTTTTVQYSEQNECRPPLQFRCVTETGHPFELSDSFAQVKSGPCTTTTQVSGYDTPIVENKKMVYVLFAIVIVIVVMVIAFALVLCIVKFRNSGTSQVPRNIKEVEMEQQKGLLQGQTTSADVQALMNTLKNAQKNMFQEYTSTPNGDSFPEEDAFQDINFTITKEGDDDNVICSSKMAQTLFGKQQSFVYLDNSEFGRKLFVQYVCSTLCPPNPDQNIILYVNLKELHSSTTIAHAIERQVTHYGLGSTNVMPFILETKKCLLVLDAIDELNQSCGYESTSNSKIQYPYNLTVKDVLSGSNLFRESKKLISLCIVKNRDNLTFSYLEKQVYIKITPLSAPNLKSYVARLFNCYKTFHETNIYKSNEGGRSNDCNKDEQGDCGQTYEKQPATSVFNLILDEENIINQLAMCPSLLILFIHALISDITKKAINNLKIYIHRRTYLTRLIIDCLYFHYFSSLEKCGHSGLLMINLGRASFENSLESVSFVGTCDLVSKFTRTQLQEKISEKDFDTAFAIGLLKLGAKGDCSEDAKDNGSSPSSDSVIEFRHNYIQEYFVAQAIASKDAVKEKFLKSQALKENERMERVLQFMHITESQKRHELLNQLVSKMRWNNLIDCLFESETDDDFMRIKSAISPSTGKYTVNIKDMDRRYHRMAVSRFCEVFANHDVSLLGITFREPCEFEYFSPMEIPEVEVIGFLGMYFLPTNKFINFVKKASQLNITKYIEFVKCKCPEKFSEGEIQEIADLMKLSSKRPKIVRIEGETDRESYILNVEKGCWERPPLFSVGK